MAGGPRDYGVAVERALYRVARGTCYYPDCTQPVIAVVEGTHVVAVEIAHIRGANPGSARYDPAMSDPERAAFANLILLCSPHHKLVDRLRPDDYPVEMLQDWKTANEPVDGIEELRTSAITDDILDQVLEELIERAGPVREAHVDLVAGIMINGYDLASFGGLEELRVILDHNPAMRLQPRILAANIRNVGTLPVSVEGVNLWVVLDEQDDDMAFTLAGRNDFGTSNPALPYRLLDGDAVQWLTKVETIEMIVQTARDKGLDVVGIRAQVQLGTGERIQSELVPWHDLG
jgi:hypothetical protein